uniref:Uncharacterized protein n=1 Tax=Pseudonaja textilis TaxID=8673 RepID=A0A670Z0Q3_PSETE
MVIFLKMTQTIYTPTTPPKESYPGFSSWLSGELQSSFRLDRILSFRLRNCSLGGRGCAGLAGGPVAPETPQPPGGPSRGAPSLPAT